MTSNFDFNSFWNSNNFQSFFKFPFDAASLLETQRKNAQALADAQKVTFEGWQALVQRQSELVSQLWQEQSAFAKEFVAEGTPEQKAARQVELAHKNFENSVENWEELSALVSENSKQASGLISSRVSESLIEFKSAFANKKADAEKTASQKKAA